jgi:lactate permease
VTFGSLGLSFFALMGATGLSGELLAPWAATLLGLACLGCGAATLWAAGGRRTLLAGLAPLVVIGATMAGAQYLVTSLGLFNIGSMVAGLAGLAVGVAWARIFRREKPTEAHNEGEGPRQALTMPLGWALAPYALLVAIVLLSTIPAIRDVLGRAVIRVEFPELVTGRGWLMPAGPGRTIKVFGHAGALLIYASALSFVIFKMRNRYQEGALREIGSGVVKRATRSSLGTAAMVGMAVMMEHAGMTHLLADGIARAAGAAFPLVSPFIGVLGAFMTGSNTNSNVVFAGLQQQVAKLAGVNALIILAAQTTGGAIGSAFAPAKVIVGCSTVDAEEGPVLKAVMRYGLIIVAAVALVTGLTIYVLGL